MTLVVQFLPRAQRDVEETVDYLRSEGATEAARRFVSSVARTARTLVATPFAGRAWPAERPRLAGLRTVSVVGFRKHMIFYLVRAESLDVVRVIHGSRDLEQVLADDAGD